MELTEKELKRIIKESLHNIISEGYGKTTTFELSDDFSIAANQLKEYSWQMEGFIKEFPVFIQKMRSIAQQFGLELQTASSEDYCDLSMLLGGHDAEFEYEYVIPGVDAMNLSDEEYETIQDKVNEIGSEFEFELNPRNFKFGQVTVTEEEVGVTIRYSFGFWD